MHYVLAALSGLGAQWLSLSLMRGVLAMTGMSRISPRELADATETISWAVASAIAVAAAGLRGISALTALAAGVMAVLFALALSSGTSLCDPAVNADCTAVPFTFLLQSWPIAAGLLIGILSGRTAASDQPGFLGLALGASIPALAPTLARLTWTLMVGPTPVGGRADGLLEWLVVTQAAAAFAMGLTAAMFGSRVPVSAGLIGGAHLLSWSPLHLQELVQRGPLPIGSRLQLFTPVVFTLAGILGLMTGAALRSIRRRSSVAAHPH